MAPKAYALRNSFLAGAKKKQGLTKSAIAAIHRPIRPPCETNHQPGHQKTRPAAVRCSSHQPKIFLWQNITRLGETHFEIFA